ncbi:MAG: squalene synthase HpnC [Rhodospirillaceae bacterium]
MTSVPASGASVEMPSGKDADYENFPVGSFLIPKELRPQVACFYAFARAIDDIADSPDLSPAEKIHRLQGFDQALIDPEFAEPGYIKGIAMRLSLEEAGIPVRHCRDLIVAFIQDSEQSRYADWADLRAYCRLSASPVGRFLVDLHGGVKNTQGDDRDYHSSDALCDALQVINHLQDCADDYRTLDRVYLPQDWMTAEGMVVSDLDRGRSTAATRRVLDRCVAGTRDLLEVARSLPDDVIHPRLALESAVILEIADRLTDMLARRDPLAERVKLSKLAYGTVFVRVLLRRGRTRLQERLLPSAINTDIRTPAP